jgi:uncharacterized protein GlcG (DUF336 family)
MSGESLTLAMAQAIIAGALAGPRTAPDKPVAVAVCDSGGHPLALAREDGAPPLLAHIAQAKAFTCVAYGRTPTALEPVAAEWPIWFEGISKVATQRMGSPLIASKGAQVIRDAAGCVLGAVGIAGETGARDDELARLGLDAAGFTPDP